MRFEGEEFEELLSGYLDNELNEAELSVVRAALESDSNLRARLEELRQVGSELKRFSVENRTHRLPPHFAQGVIAESRRRAISENLPQSHHVVRGKNRGDTLTAVARDEQREVALPQMPSWRVPAGIIGAIASVAALLLLMFWFSSDSKDTLTNNSLISSSELIPDSGTTSPETNLVEPDPVAPTPDAGEERYVSELQENQLAFVFVVDLELSEDALENEFLATVFANSGITLEKPIVADDTVLTEISKARVIVDGDPQEAPADVQMYFVHADHVAAGKALETLYQDLQSVPALRFGLLFDNPLNKVTYRIAKSTGMRFAAKDSIAAPVTASESVRISPFSGIGPQGMLVSSGKRIGPNERADLSFVTEGESTILILLRVPK